MFVNVTEAMAIQIPACPESIKKLHSAKAGKLQARPVPLPTLRGNGKRCAL
jgi:hypothetical protein